MREEEAREAITEKQRVLGESLETALDKRSEYEQVLKKYLDQRKTPEIPVLVSNENIAQREITREEACLEPIIDSRQRGISLSIQGISMRHVSILDELGINTNDELSIQDPEQLYRTIIEWNTQNKINYEYLPSRGMVKRWIRIAKQVTGLDNA